MAKRFTDTDIWKKEWFLNLSLKHKLLVKFLFDNCDCAGVYEPNYILLSVCIGENITEKDIEEIKQVRKLENGNFFIEDFLDFQYNIKSFEDLKPKFSVHKGIIKSLQKNGLISDTLEPTKIKEEPPKPPTEEVNDPEKLYGEYSNVYLPKKQYDKLLGICASEKLLNELIYSFSIAIEVGKERPYTAELPNAHFERLKSYYNYRMKYPEKFREESDKNNDDEILERIRKRKEGFDYENMGIS